mmetsp:Transcript_11084/g.18109  ORF Transcript_11084/g.18109 Transcript_11084/m.18109 type:complete len:416 (-) Transcript_11084:142-1389(-)|eukprot:CAMPEP_0114428712 /NCGR_PEP_ID=MMETSP0103-20121206/9084_1 /TAXON_ID=37642 ORGANISM="Paraphysomonas imperforata, Strain PA2" /NCGR_SAMPLE_ID=MMETSP0103 /ASSEMBLY_ACC=CAM_ASM_000201 /LENGTH=415 /DNA_ID=CAMNT_0001597971 /DNA_START=44 /DNA_END=1291 /DNA_ORIENTATION=+
MFSKAVLVSGLSVVSAIDNGKGLTPPMGWRSWNLFGENVNQDLIQKQMDGMTSRARTVNGVPTSLLDLGYTDVGLDDAWQLCGEYGPDKNTYHDEVGKPVVDTSVFPNFNAMTDYAHSLGLTAGWYANNCICEDHCDSDACYQEDVNALVAYGFDSVKLDGCGAQLDLQKWSDMINQTGHSILIENCHWGGTVPNATWCPWNYYRTSGDIRASYESVIANLMTTVPFAKQSLSTPGCWAYPDMLEVGCKHGPGGDNDPGLSYNEARTHFAAWAVTSSPLILSHDTTDDNVTDSIWSIISNTEVIAINQAWDGDSGSVYAESTSKVRLGDTIVSSWQQWCKQIAPNSVAVLLINNSPQLQNVPLDLSKCPTFTALGYNGYYSGRDVYNHYNLGTVPTTATYRLHGHDSAFGTFTYG